MSVLDLRRVSDEAGLRAYHRILDASFAVDFEALPADPIHDLRPALSGSLGTEQVELWTAAANGDAVAAVTVRYSAHDNLDLATVSVQVHPDHRGRGHGKAAAEAAVARVRDLGRRRVLAEVPTHTKLAKPSIGELLARSLGARPMLVEMRRLLDIAALSATDVTALHTKAVEVSTGYSTVAWRDHTPAQHVPAMAELLSLMSTDPPQGELDLEPERWDSDRYLERERSIIERRRIHLTVAAREDASGCLVGFTDIGVPGGGATVGYQWDTIVRQAHRGHRLGMLMKTANLEHLRAVLPGLTYLNTWNAAANGYMVAVNDALGYRPMEGWSEWQLDL